MIPENRGTRAQEARHGNDGHPLESPGCADLVSYIVSCRSRAADLDLQPLRTTCVRNNVAENRSAILNREALRVPPLQCRGRSTSDAQLALIGDLDRVLARFGPRFCLSFKMTASRQVRKVRGEYDYYDP